MDERSQVRPWRPDRVADDDRMEKGRRARPDVSGELGQAGVNFSRPQNVNLYSAAVRNMEELRDAALCIADHIHSLMRDGIPASTGRSD